MAGSGGVNSIALQTMDGWDVPNVTWMIPAPGQLALTRQSHGLLLNSATRLSDDSGSYNCFGLVFAARRTNVNVPTAPASIDEILRRDRYARVRSAQVGDVIAYRDLSEEIEHVGIVVAVDPLLPGGKPLVRVWSMWGGLGEFLHEERVCPYDGRVEYWRAQR